jgi:hypothetical protein
MHRRARSAPEAPAPWRSHWGITRNRATRNVR